jgi:hypothetical protein
VFKDVCIPGGSAWRDHAGTGAERPPISRVSRVSRKVSLSRFSRIRRVRRLNKIGAKRTSRAVGFVGLVELVGASIVYRNASVSKIIRGNEKA